MMKNSLIKKSIACALLTSCVYGAFTYSEERLTPKKIDLSAFRNAYENFETISKKEQVLKGETINYKDVTGGIVQTIEKELRSKIVKSRFQLSIEKTLAKSKEVKFKTIAKNWNEIKPEFALESLSGGDVKLQVQSLNELAPNEINNKELLILGKFDFESQLALKLSDLELPLTYEEKNIIAADENKENNEYKKSDEIMQSDEVATSQAAPANSSELGKEGEVASLEAEEKVEEKYNDEDMVMFDYSAKNEAPKKIFDAPLSASVKEAINRELHDGKSEIKTMAQVSTQKPKFTGGTNLNQKELDEAMNNEDAIVYDYATKAQASTINKERSTERALSAFTANEDNAEKITFELEAKEINLNTQKVRVATGFEFVPDFDRSERLDDQAIGKITFDYSLDKSLSIQAGVVQSLGNIPTRIEMDLLKGRMSIPLINEEGIQKYLEKKGLNINGGLILLAIDESIQDVEIDRDYQAKIYFNNKFKTTESKANAAYVMILGVNPGNIMVRYLLKNNESSQKIIYLGDGEMYYEDPSFIVSERDIYSFTTRSLLGKKVKELNIDANLVSFFGSKATSKKKALNAYEIKVPTMVENERKYLEFKHLNSNLYVGTSEAKDIEIPSLDFINKVLDQKNMRPMGQRCLVQINLTKDVREVKANGKNKQGEMFVELNYLDSDGNFSDETPEMAEKIFVGGDQEGLLNIKIDFTDGSTGFLKSYCSEGSYLVEQI